MFRPDENGSVSSVALQPDAKVLLAGLFTAVEEASRNRIARLNADGSLDSTFDPGTGANNIIYSLILQPDGKGLVAGPFTAINGVGRAKVARLLGDPVVISLRSAGNEVVLSWTSTGFSLQSAPFATGPFTNVLGAGSPYTNPVASPQQYFRLKSD